MLGKMQVRMCKSKSKMELIDTHFRPFLSISKEGEDDKKKKKEGGKKIHMCYSRIRSHRVITQSVTNL